MRRFYLLMAWFVSENTVFSSEPNIAFNLNQSLWQIFMSLLSVQCVVRPSDKIPSQCKCYNLVFQAQDCKKLSWDVSLLLLLVFVNVDVLVDAPLFNEVVCRSCDELRVVDPKQIINAHRMCLYEVLDQKSCFGIENSN